MKRIAISVASVLIVAAVSSVNCEAQTTKSATLVGGGVQEITNIPFSQSALIAMTDGNTATGFTFTSNFGDFVANQSEGVAELFKFDVSGFSSISKIDVSWTGTYEWSPGFQNPFPTLRLGVAGETNFTSIFGFDSNFMSTGNVETGSRSFTGSSIANMVSGNLASACITTDFGTSAAHTFMRVGTLEITANVTGVFVPEPTASGLVAFSLLACLTNRRRPTSHNRA